MAETKKTAVAKPVAKVAAANAADVKKEEVKPEAVKEAPKAEVKKPEAKKAAAKKETAKKESVKKEAAKKTAKKTTAKKAGAAEKTVKAGAKKAVDAEVVMQFAGNDYTTEKLIGIAQDVWKYDLNGKPEDFKSVKLYVKPEEKVVYYVINGDVSGSFGI